MSIVRTLAARLALLAGLASAPALAEERWQTLPPTPAPVAGETTGTVEVGGAKLFYATTGATTGHEPPVVLLHGGLANSDYWGEQVRALAPHHLVVLIDSRGHGRSTRSAAPFGYDMMADDVVAVLDRLGIARADVVGWSDGAILGLDMAMRQPSRVRRVFAFAANTVVSGVKDDVARNPTFAAFIRRAGDEYRRLSPTPGRYDAFVEQISHMWASQPNWSDADLRRITAPVLVADGDHDEAIKRTHVDYMAATIPGAGLLILPHASHFAFLQDPGLFNAALLGFLDAP